MSSAELLEAGQRPDERRVAVFAANAEVGAEFGQVDHRLGVGDNDEPEAALQPRADCSEYGEIHKRFSHEGKYRDPGVLVPEEERLIVELEGPRHAILRKLVNSALHPRSVTAMEPQAVQIAHQLIDQFIEQGEVELSSAYADRFSSRVFARLVGIPEEDEVMVRGWALEFVSEPNMRTPTAAIRRQVHRGSPQPVSQGVAWLLCLWQLDHGVPRS